MNHDEHDVPLNIKVEIPEQEVVDPSVDYAVNVTKHVEQEIAPTGTIGVVQSVGHLLCNARLARGMSIEDVSRQLHLSVQQIDAIEKEDYEKLPGHTFIRGFVRNYANLMQLDPTTILPLLPQSSPIAPVQRTPFQIKEASLSSGYGKGGNRLLMPVAALVFMVLLIYGIYQSSDWLLRSMGLSEKEHVLETEETGQTTVELQLPLSTVSSADTLRELNNTPLLSADSQLTTLKPIENVIGTLHFLFTTESWVEVKDGSGKVIFEQMNARGSERVVNGKRPLSLVIRNAVGVNLTYNDRSIDISPYINAEEGMARFTLE